MIVASNALIGRRVRGVRSWIARVVQRWTVTALATHGNQRRRPAERIKAARQAVACRVAFATERIGVETLGFDRLPRMAMRGAGVLLRFNRMTLRAGGIARQRSMSPAAPGGIGAANPLCSAVISRFLQLSEILMKDGCQAADRPGIAHPSLNDLGLPTSVELRRRFKIDLIRKLPFAR